MTNLLVIVADDMRYDHLAYLPSVRRLLQEPGRTFDGARCNVPLCQPNRVSFFTGQNSRHHGEVGVGLSGVHYDGHENTVGLWLADAGYRCGLFGKYVNFYDEFGGIPGPAGWATWRQYARERTAEDFDVHHEDSVVRVSGTFQTEYLAAETSEFFAGPEPWFCYVAPRHPHAPFAPHPSDLHAWSDRRAEVIELTDEEMRSKPFWMHDVPELTTAEWAQVHQDFRGRLRELSAIDRMVEAMVGELDRLGRLDDTVIAFTSDNGVHQGEQRRTGDGTKGGPYDVGLRVPLVVRGPGFAPGPDISVPVYPAADLAATLVDVAGASAGLPDQAGLSLREVAARPADRVHTQRVLLHEVGEGFLSTGDGVTTGPEHDVGYVKTYRYPSVRESPEADRVWEMYDLAADPDERQSLAKVSSERPLLDRMSDLLDQALT